MATAKKKAPAKKAAPAKKVANKDPKPPRSPRETGSGSYSTNNKGVARSYVGGGSSGNAMVGSTPRGGGGLTNRGK